MFTPLRTFTAVVHRAEQMYVAACPEVGTVDCPPRQVRRRRCQPERGYGVSGGIPAAVHRSADADHVRAQLCPELPRVSGAQTSRALENRGLRKFGNAEAM